MYRRLQRYMCKCSWKHLCDAVITYIDFTGFNGFVGMVVFGQRLDLMIFQDFSNFSDSVIHFAWDVLFLVVFSLIVTVPAWCSASGTWIYTHALTHRIRELMPISLYVLFFCSLLSVVLSEACSAASPL